MSTPTESELQTQIKNAVKIYKDLLSAGTTHIADEDTLLQSLEGDHYDATVSAMASTRAGLNGALTSEAATLTPMFREYGKIINFPRRDVHQIFVQLRRRFRDLAYTVNSRGISFGSITANGGNIGNGSCVRVTVDEDGNTIEAVHAEVKTIECVQDEHSGASENAEVFEIRGGIALKDSLQVSGSGLTGNLTAISSTISQSYLENSSFSANASSTTVTAVTSITGWTLDSITGVSIDETDYYNTYVGDATPRSLSFARNNGIQQNFNNVLAQFSPDRPYVFQVAYNASAGAASGSNMKLTLTVGSKSVVVSGITSATGWTVLRLTLGANCYMKNWNQEDPLFRVALTGMNTASATTYFLIDTCIVAPMTSFDGLYYAIVAGRTPFLARTASLDGDKFTLSDTISTDAVIQRHLFYALGEYLPSNNAGAETWTDP